LREKAYVENKMGHHQRNEVPSRHKRAHWLTINVHVKKKLSEKRAEGAALPPGVSKPIACRVRVVYHHSA